MHILYFQRSTLMRVQKFQEHVPHGILDPPTIRGLLVFQPVRGGNPQKKRHILGNGFPSQLYDFSSQTCTVLEAATVIVGALIASWRKKRME